MANDENLIPLTSRSEREQYEIRSRGGKRRSPKKQLAAYIKYMRQFGMKNKAVENMVACIESVDVSALSIKKYINQLMDLAIQNNDEFAMREAVKLMLRWHKTVHGGKSTEININTNPAPTEIIILPPEKNE